jgi:hypothetical protein
MNAHTNAKPCTLHAISMRLFRFISNFFKSPSLDGEIFEISKEENRKSWEIKQSELGIFTFNKNGFDINLETKLYRIKWTAIERLQAYKVDLLTTDEICMDITFDNQCIRITEEIHGWYQFIDHMQIALPVNENWNAEVLKSPFSYDLTTIYERADRKMPEQSNFFSVIEENTKEYVSHLFEKAGWEIHKPSMKAYSLENSWTDLVLDNDNVGKSLLVHGLVAYHEDNVNALEALYKKLGCPYKLEFYDEQQNLLLERLNGM